MLHPLAPPAASEEAIASHVKRGGLRSETYVPQTMPKVFTSIDLAALYLITILFVTNVPNAIAGGAATFTYWLLGFLGFFLPSILMTAQLAVMFPYEGGLYHWTHQALGRYWSFFATFCAWFPAILLIVSTPALLVGVVQGLHPTWLVEPWQQGLVIAGLVVLSGIIALQRQRTVALFLTMTAAFLVLGLLLIGFSGVFWLVMGHPSATSFVHLSDWSINWSASTGNLGVLGVVGLACLGADIPARLLGETRAEGEASRRHLITRHLLLGSLLVVGGYLLVTWSLLVVQGTQANFTLFALISTVDMTLGKVAGDMVALCLLLWLVAATVAYNATYARLLLVGGIDQRLPIRVARLNRHRVPAAAIVFQTATAVVVTFLTYCALPYVIQLGVKPLDLATGILNVMLAGLSLLWVASTLFLFIDVGILMRRHPHTLRAHRLISPRLLLVSAILGTVFGLLAIVDTLTNSWIPTIVGNSQWWYLVGGLTLVCLLIALIGSMFASSEAAWERISKAHLRQEGGTVR